MNGRSEVNGIEFVQVRPASLQNIQCPSRTQDFPVQQDRRLTTLNHAACITATSNLGGDWAAFDP